MASYKGYTADIKVDENSQLLVGRVLDIKDKITFHGETVAEAIQEFEKSIDSYLKFCQELGQTPDKPFSGKLPFRTTPDVHRAIYLASTKAEKSINSWMEEVLKKALRRKSSNYHSVKTLIEKESNVQALLARVSNLLVDDSSLAKEGFIDALEKFLIGLEEIKHFIKSEPGNKNLLELIKEICFFLDENKNEHGGRAALSPSSDSLAIGTLMNGVGEAEESARY